MNKALFTGIALALATSSAKASLSSFSDDFNTASSGDYTEGGVLAGNNGWTSQNPTADELPFYTTDIAGTGLVKIEGSTDNFISMGRNVGTFDVGETVTVSSLFNIGNANGSAFDTAVAWNIGLGDTWNGIDLGLSIGGEGTDWFARTTDNVNGNTTLTDDSSGPLAGEGRDTDQHTISLTITKTATDDTFDVSMYFDSTTLFSQTVVHAALYDATSIFLVGGAGGGGVNAVGGIDIDNFSIVPEPGTYALLTGFAALSLVAARRRK